MKVARRWLIPTMALFVPLIHASSGQAQASGDSQPPVSIPCSRAHKLRSTINGRTYPINVALPPQYCLPRSDTTRYPVLYFLDDQMKAATPQDRMRRAGAPNSGGLIIVGIAIPPNPQGIPGSQFYHSIDYLTPASAAFPDSGIVASDRVTHTIARTLTKGHVDQVMRGQPGEAPTFLRVLQEEIVPMIDRTYRTTGDRGLFGHSNGGFFAAYAMFAAPGFFRRIALGSPALWWDDYWIFAREVEFRATHKALNVDLLLMAAEEEHAFMRADVLRFASILGWREYEGLRVRTSITRGGHFSTDDVRQTLELLYPLSP
jgi:predicted alpha/beta superfamily hydrolase